MSSPKKYIHKKIFLYYPNNPVAYFQKYPTAYYLFPKCTPDLSCCTALLILTPSTSLFLQSHFFKSHPSFKVGFNVTSFMEYSMISVLKNIESLPPLNLQISRLYFFYCIYYISPAVMATEYLIHLLNCALRPGKISNSMCFPLKHLTYCLIHTKVSFYM